MKSKIQILLGFLITVFIFIVSNLLGKFVDFKIQFIPSSFIVHTSMLFFSIVMIYVFRKQLNFKFSFPKIKNVFIPFFIAFFVSILITIAINIISISIGLKIEQHPLLAELNPLQVLIFVFFYASLAEELLFRGFLLNFLNNHIKHSFSFFKWNIKLSILISGFMFGLAHLILMKYHVGVNFLITVVILTTILGIIAGIYQEKYKNTFFAVIVHMGANLLALLGSIITSQIVQ
jgi:membrane protease YdiL (CAAX protease family)